MEIIRIKDDYIKLGQALKLSGMCDSGVEAKFIIGDGQVQVNGKEELQRGKKLYHGDVVTYDGRSIKIEG
ncbi:MAG: RNA-binding S4 domain-containing protein [Lachnospiraceae bacterium]|jgi:ribosome-associated protein|nr:RNA-binding S4 domain-containing protein [Lachnospiraceae bacterium]